MILFYFAAFLTSAWLWAYILIAYALRLLRSVPGVVRFLSKIMDLNEHPVRSVGYVVAAVSSMIIAVITVL